MLKVIRKAVTIIDAFTQGTPECSLGELTAHVQMPKATVHHILDSLRHAGWITQNPTTKKYRLGVRLWQLGCITVQGLHLQNMPHPYMVDLADRTGESVHLSIVDMAEPSYAVYIDKIESDNPVREYSIIGGRSPSYCVASGKAILAFNPHLVSLLLKKKLQRYTKSTIVDPDELWQELKAAKKLGYAVNNGEYREDVIGAAAPIRNHDGSVIAAVGISGPAYRVTKTFLAKSISVVIETADKISAQLGYFETTEKLGRGKEAKALNSVGGLTRRSPASMRSTGSP